MASSGEVAAYTARTSFDDSAPNQSGLTLYLCVCFGAEQISSASYQVFALLRTLSYI